MVVAISSMSQMKRNKLPLGILGFTSIIIAVMISFNSYSLKELVVESLIFAIIIFGIFVLFLKLIQNINSKNVTKSIQFLIALAFLLFILVVAYNLIVGNWGCTTPNSRGYFVTNIITGRCEYLGGTPKCGSKPWYYEYNCLEDKEAEAFKDTNYYGKRLQECTLYCERQSTVRWNISLYDFCFTPYFNAGKKEVPITLDCNLIVQCDQIKC